jgi:predicted HicB family RNase H-like nuclease
MSRSALIAVHVEPELEKRVKRAAASDDRSISNWVRLALLQRLLESGDRHGDVVADIERE